MEISSSLGPLGVAAQALAEPASLPARRGGASAPPPPSPYASHVSHASQASQSGVGAASVLADLLDLRGSVALAEALPDLEPPADALYDPSGAAALHADVRARLGELEEKLAKACDDLLSGKASALAASRIATAVADLAIDPRGVERAGGIAWAPAADYLALRLDRVRAAAADLREEIGPAVGLISREARRLEKLDAVLSDVTRETESKLFARIAPAQERRFARALVRFVPEHGATEAAIRAGLAKGGGLRDAVEAAVFATLAVFRHDRTRIEGLVEAARRTVSG